MIVPVEAAKEGVTVGGDKVTGLMFADDFEGVSETPEGLQKEIELGTININRVHTENESDSERNKVRSSSMKPR